MCITNKFSAHFAVFITVLVYPLVMSSFSNPKYTYPLCDLSYAFEIIDAGTISTENDQCGFHFNGSHSELSCVPLSLDGDIYPYVDLSVSGSNELKEWSFALFFKPRSMIGVQVIFHYKYFGILTEVTELILSIDNGTIQFCVIGGSSESDMATLKMSISIGADYWTFIALSKVYSTGQLKMAVKTDTPGVSAKSLNSVENNNITSQRLNAPGTLRIGNNLDGNNGFDGQITCVTIYDFHGLADDTTPYPSVVDACKQPWGKSPTGLPSLQSTGCVTTAQQTITLPQTTITMSCAQTPTAPEIMFFRKIPQSNMTGVTPAMTNINSAVRCASMCSREQCVAFVITLVNGISQSCSLYNSYHLAYITSDPDSYLYVQSDC